MRPAPDKKKGKGRRRFIRNENRLSKLEQTRPGEGIGFDPAMQQLLLGYQQQADQAQVGLQGELQGLQTEYFDPNDPYSRQALASRSADLARRGQSLSASSSGKLYSGANMGQARDLEYTLGADQENLLREYQGRTQQALGGYRGEVSGLAQQGNQAVYDAATRRAGDISSTAIPPVPRGRRGRRRNRRVRNQT